MFFSQRSHPFTLMLASDGALEAMIRLLGVGRVHLARGEKVANHPFDRLYLRVNEVSQLIDQLLALTGQPDTPLPEHAQFEIDEWFPGLSCQQTVELIEQEVELMHSRLL